MNCTTIHNRVREARSRIKVSGKRFSTHAGSDIQGSTDILKSVHTEEFHMSRRTLTFSLPTDVIIKAKILAAQRQTSLSGLFAACIEEMAARDDAYQAASRRALTYLNEGFNLGVAPAVREELHARLGLPRLQRSRIRPRSR